MSAPRNVFEALLMIIGVCGVISFLVAAWPSAPVHSLEPSNTAALTPDLMNAAENSRSNASANADCSDSENESNCVVGVKSSGLAGVKGVEVGVGAGVEVGAGATIAAAVLDSCRVGVGPAVDSSGVGVGSGDELLDVSTTAGASGAFADSDSRAVGVASSEVDWAGGVMARASFGAEGLGSPLQPSTETIASNTSIHSFINQGPL